MSHPLRHRGFTLIELIVVIALVALLAAVVAPNLLGRASDAKRKSATVQLEKVSNAIELYRLETGRYPEDLEAQTFYALSLLGLSQGDRDVPTYMEAGTIALAALRTNPDHPGAAHYTIHAFDDPTHAVLAMEDARKFGGAPPRQLPGVRAVASRIHHELGR